MSKVKWTARLFAAAAVAGLVTAGASTASAAPVPVNSWTQWAGSGTLSGANTDSPSLTASVGNVITGVWGPGGVPSTISLANVGDMVVLKGDISWTGAPQIDANGGFSHPTAFRLGLFKTDAEYPLANDDNIEGYFFESEDIYNNLVAGLWGARPSNFISNGSGATNLPEELGTLVETGGWDNAQSYDWELKITRTGANEALVQFTLTDSGAPGPNGPVNVFVEATDSDVTGTSTGTFDFDFVVWSTGGVGGPNPGSETQALSPVSIEYIPIPEPASLGLLAVGVTLFSLRRRS